MTTTFSINVMLFRSLKRIVSTPCVTYPFITITILITFLVPTVKNIVTFHFDPVPNQIISVVILGDRHQITDHIKELLVNHLLILPLPCLTSPCVSPSLRTFQYFNTPRQQTVMVPSVLHTDQRQTNQLVVTKESFSHVIHFGGPSSIQ